MTRGLAQVVLLGDSHGGARVTASFSQVREWSSRSVELPSSLLAALASGSGTALCWIRPAPPPSAAPLGTVVLPPPVQGKRAPGQDRFAYAVGRVLSVDAYEVQVDWPGGFASTLPPALFAADPAPGSTFALCCGPVRAPEIPPYGD